MPYTIAELAGQPYRPSNGTEGDLFMAQFCAHCTLNDDDGCPIMVRTFLHLIGDPEYPLEWTHTAEGTPTCTAFVARTVEGVPS